MTIQKLLVKKGYVISINNKKKNEYVGTAYFDNTNSSDEENPGCGGSRRKLQIWFDYSHTGGTENAIYIIIFNPVFS